MEMLVQIFNSFMQTLTSSDDRIRRVSNFSHKLIQEDNAHSEMIKRKMES